MHTMKPDNTTIPDNITKPSNHSTRGRGWDTKKRKTTDVLPLGGGKLRCRDVLGLGSGRGSCLNPEGQKGGGWISLSAGVTASKGTVYSTGL